MPVSIPLGWDVFMAVNGYTRVGRLFISGSNTWMNEDRYPSYPGYDGFNDTSYRSEHDILQNEIIWWLTGKSSGASILLSGDGVSIQSMGPEFQAGLVRNGHTVTLTGGSGTLGGYDPLNFDCWLIANGSTSFSNAYIDSYLAANGALWWTMNSFAPTYLGRYGISASGFQSDPPPFGHPYWSYYTTVTAFSPLVTQTVRCAIYSDVKLATDTNTMGGTNGYYYNTVSEMTFATWENA